MRYILMVKATGHSEAGVRPSREYREAMTAYKESLDKSGVLLAAEELQPSASGVRITYPAHGGKPKVTVGPFAREKELVAGYILMEVSSEEEAVEWAMRMPHPSVFSGGEVELRQLIEDANPPQAPHTRFLEADLRDQIDMLKKS
ncbi:YciI family protein [Paenibacillus spongiae]|uniref:YciI family protein n=1 Tax=Paenibacillus spongiae TaxID=2909671 RepID=A0ABY5S9N2_9BACL|nr:YciI family protein [Paenibacillus spongiae]UVI30439.1 YciI family protein [Paenibacillus spongiae]